MSVLPGLLQPDPLPNVTTTRTDTPNVPEYYNNYLNTLAQAGQTAIGADPNSLVAGFTNLQNQGFGGVGQAANAYQPGLNQAVGTANQGINQGQQYLGQASGALASATGQYQPAFNQAVGMAGQAASGVTQPDINMFMNPYTTNVVNEMERLNQQNVQRNLLPSLKSSFVGSGSLGSQRYANATGQALSDNSLGLLGQQAGALSSGYQNSVQAALENARLRQAGAANYANVAQSAQQAGLRDYEANANMARLAQELGLSGANTQAQLAGQQQSMGLTGANAQLQAGALQQQLDQARIEAPLTRASNAAQLLRGLNIPLGATSTVTGPGNQSQFGLSPLNQIGSLASLLGAIPSGNTTLGNQVGSFLGNIFSGLNNSNLTFPSGTPVLDAGQPSDLTYP